MTQRSGAGVMDAEELIGRVEEILDAEVRPYLASHAGNIEVAELDADGVLRVNLVGQCARCPAAQDEIGSFVTTTVREALPEVTDVRASSGVSESLLAQARIFLSSRPRRDLRGRVHLPIV